MHGACQDGERTEQLAESDLLPAPTWTSDERLSMHFQRKGGSLAHTSSRAGEAECDRVSFPCVYIKENTCPLGCTHNGCR